MEEFHAATTVGLIACCQCGLPIQPNPANMCSGCIRSKVDITEGISRTCMFPCLLTSCSLSDCFLSATIYICKFCDRYFVPPSGWMRAEPESKELLSICLKKMKPQLLKVRLTDACFVWTEAHSKRIKVKLTIQKEVFNNTILQQTFVVEFTVHNQARNFILGSSASISYYLCVDEAEYESMCDDCRRAEAKDFWRACVQVRQKAEFKKTLFYLEQLLLKHGVSIFCSRDNIVCMPKKVAQQLGNMSQIAICLRVSNVITLIDPNNLQMADIQATTFWRDPFDSLCTPKQLSEFYVLDVERVDNLERKAGHGFVSKKHVLADVWLVRSHQVGMSDAQTLSTRTHLGHLLNPGDLVLAFDIRNCNVNNTVFDEMKPEDIPDVVIVKKVYDRARRVARRQWKLKRLVVDGNIVGNETESVADEFQRFMEDVEEDPYMREKINIYKDEQKLQQPVDDDDEAIPDAPTLAEMLDELTFEDTEMRDEAGECSQEEAMDK
ncbi:NMD3 family protein [Ancylostoma duodenale]|uniref:60S ribosomal export protein NMD3 n=1 Tax=Ancylostoma duodenale TaxID=51022 RepID=A0A0C2GMS4_9BILA|nr:NMD3 family protein [Ancylostoma duodenale]